MHLTRHTDYALRLLMHLAVMSPSRVTLETAAEIFGISQNHLIKVSQTLAAHGYVISVRGRGGGIELAQAPDAICIGAVVRQTEENLALVECFSKERNLCPITDACRLKGAFNRALQAFLAELDAVTLAELVEENTGLKRMLAP